MDIIVIVGRKKLGKSTLAYYLASKKYKKPVAIFDPNSQYGMVEPDKIDSDFIATLRDPSNKIAIFQPYNNPEQAFSIFGKVLWNVQDFTMIVDEASILQSANWTHDWLDRWIRQGHVNKATLILTLHRPRDVSTFVRSQATEWYFFRTTLRHDLKSIDDFCVEGVSDRVAQLQNRDWLHYDVNDEAFDVCENPKQWYVDIDSATSRNVAT